MWACYGTNSYQVWEQADINTECPTFFPWIGITQKQDPWTGSSL